MRRLFDRAVIGTPGLGIKAAHRADVGRRQRPQSSVFAALFWLALVGVAWGSRLLNESGRPDRLGRA